MKRRRRTRMALLALAVLATGALAAGAPAVAAPAAPDAPPAAGPLFRVCKDGKWGYIDRRGEIVIAPRFDRAEPFSGGLAAVALGPTRGYVDARGDVVLVPPQPPEGLVHRPFSSGRALVRDGGRYGFIDREGRLAIPARWLRAQDFSEGYALVCDEDGCGYVDPAGRGVAAISPMGGKPVKGGIGATWLAMAMSRERVALLDLESGRRLPGVFEGAGGLSEGLIAARVDDLWGYVDRGGRGVIPPTFAWAGDFSEGLAAAGDASGLCGYVDRTGAFAIPPTFRACAPFSSGLARVDLSRTESEGEQVAFVDRSGRPAIVGARMQPRFDTAEDFVDGLAAVGLGGPPAAAGTGPLLGYVDTSGRYVWKPTQ